MPSIPQHLWDHPVTLTYLQKKRAGCFFPACCSSCPLAGRRLWNISWCHHSAGELDVTCWFMVTAPRAIPVLRAAFLCWICLTDAVELCGAPGKGFQTGSRSVNDKTSRFPLSRGGWRREVGVTLPQMDLLESSATAEGQSLSKFPAWLEIGWIAPKSQRAPDTESRARQRGLEPGACAGGNCVQQSQVSPEGPGESQGRGDAAGDECLITKPHPKSAARFPRLEAMPAGGGGECCPCGSVGKGWQSCSRVSAFVLQRSRVPLLG